MAEVKNDVQAFIDRWRDSEAAETANFHGFIYGLCSLIGVDPPNPSSSVVSKNTYSFERSVLLHNGDGNTTTNFIDLYKKGCFVLEAKQGSDAKTPTESEKLGGEMLRRKLGTAKRGTRGWMQAMEKARQQALRYARALPTEDGWPPFLVVVDVGYSIDLYADFTRQGKVYTPFPDAASFRIRLEELDSEKICEQLRLVWTDPLALDPTRRLERATRDLAARLAKLASSMENEGHEPERVAKFLMRSLFTMFAEDARLLPERSFTKLLERYRERTDVLPKALTHLWKMMDTGGFTPALDVQLPRFNGSLFSDADALPVSEAQVELLIKAARADWKDVEPAIFGTLLERALDPRERHKLGAHFTPRAYVERLVIPTVVEPLREHWQAAQAAALQRESSGDLEAARQEIEAFHRRLCSVRILDPACGSGNFLYVALEHLKRLEGEVLEVMQGYGGQQVFDMTGGFTVSPEQLLGLELNPRAAAIADVVLWIGYLQWHLRTYGSAKRLDPPILKKYGNIRHRDSLLSYKERLPRLDERNQPITRWDGHTFKQHPVTGENVPDESARVLVYDFMDPSPAEWPQADFIIGNPPFLGSQFMRGVLGPGYTEALRTTYADVPESADLVMYFWHKAAELVRIHEPLSDAEMESRLKRKRPIPPSLLRFGFITTNSIKQTFNRRVLERHLSAERPLSLVYAIPDHPWVDSIDGAAVRIAMTVGERGNLPGRLATVVREVDGDGMARQVKLDEQEGVLWPDLTIGADVAGATPLRANENLSFMGVKLVGDFVVNQEQAEELGLGRIDGIELHIPKFRNGRDITRTCRGVRAIDLFGVSSEEARDRFPEVYQYVLTRVKPDRDAKKHNSKDAAEYATRWWQHAKPRPEMREALTGLRRYIATSETSKHRFFVFLEGVILADGALIVVASDDAYHLGVLSSKFHTVWAFTSGGRLEDRPRYNSTKTFQPYPFPEATDRQRDRIRAISERLDAHRKKRQDLYPKLTLTSCYNVLEKLRAEEPLDESERGIFKQGAIGVLMEVHDELNQAVADAYGWSVDLGDGEILRHLVDLNTQRKYEEEHGLVRYLRPSFQNPDGGDQTALAVLTNSIKKSKQKVDRQTWPTSLSERVQAVQRTLASAAEPLKIEEINRRFTGGRNRVDQVESILATLEALGAARLTEDGRYAE